MQLIDKDKLKEALENEGADVFADRGYYALPVEMVLGIDWENKEEF